MMAERGMIIDYFTLHRLIPLLNKAFRWHKWNAAAALRFFKCHISIHGTDYSR
ncbi:IS1327 transposase [Yersinia aldovae ATCC 35236]|nr:IS1327 transposase [Yersinia aldovae ATCC 35236]